MNPSGELKVFTNIPFHNAPVNLISEIRQDLGIGLDLPWDSVEPGQIAFAAWEDFCPAKEAAVLYTITDAFNSPVLVIQRWTLAEDLLDSLLPQ